jgi:IS605 OrfB family transposase
MYRDNMFIRTGTYTASIKVFTRNTWDWLEIGLRKGDADYITRHCRDRRECVPTLHKRGKLWYLDFAFEEKIDLPDTEACGRRILAVDLGINSACTCCVMGPDGTVTGRRSLKLSGENDRLARAVGRIKRAQQHGARRMPRLWARAKGISSDIAVKTAEFIVKTAVRYKVDVIVMEHLDIRGRKRGSRKQRLHHWRAMYVQRMVAQKAHRGRIRVSTVCAWNTSRLAFDGSGRVKRGKESEKTADNYSICEFSTGKIYNCDLNASYNIGARYFIRELLKSLPETEEQRLEAKDPSVSRRSTCTLSTLINLSAALTAAAV